MKALEIEPAELPDIILGYILYENKALANPKEILNIYITKMIHSH